MDHLEEQMLEELYSILLSQSDLDFLMLHFLMLHSTLVLLETF